MATLVEGISKTIQEVLSGGIQESLPRLDPVWKLFHETYAEVTSAGIGRDWTVIHTFSESLSGATKWTDPGGPTVDNTTLTHSIIPTDVEEYPGLEDVSLPGYLQKTITLSKMMGNMFVPREYLYSERLPASVGDVVMDIIRGTAQQVALSHIIPFYSTDATTKSLIGTVGAVTNDNTVAVTCDIKGAVNQFYNGQHVSVYTTTVDQYPNTQIVVDGVKYVPEDSDAGYGHVILKSKDGVTSLDIDVGDLIVMNDSYGKGPASPSSWLVNTGTVFGIDFATHEQFHSVNVSSVGELTETLLSRYCARLWKAYGPMDFIDCVLTSMGVTLYLLDTSFGVSAPRFIRDLGDSNKLMNYGFQEPGRSAFIFNGIPIRWMVTPYMPSTSTMAAPTGGILWGLKTRDKNLYRYKLPPLPGSQQSEQFGREVEFYFGRGGPAGLFTPWHSTSARLTNWQQAPFQAYSAICPKKFPGLNLTGLNEEL